MPPTKQINYWTLERCTEDALGYETRREWHRHSGGYRAALRNNWLDECCAHMSSTRKPNGYWTFEKCKQDALKFQTPGEWIRSSSGYQAASKKGWLDECCAHMEDMRGKGKQRIDIPERAARNAARAIADYEEGSGWQVIVPVLHDEEEEVPVFPYSGRTFEEERSEEFVVFLYGRFGVEKMEAAIKDFNNIPPECPEEKGCRYCNWVRTNQND